MQAETLVSVDEYLSTSYRPDCEYLDGVLLERNLGEWDHSRIQTLVTGCLLNRERQWRIKVVVEQRVQVSATRFRVPDVCAVDAANAIEQIITSPPLLCIEILSKDDTMSEMQERISDYLRFGVPAVWVIDPGKRRAWNFTSEGMREAGQALRVEGREITVPLEEIFP